MFKSIKQKILWMEVDSPRVYVTIGPFFFLFHLLISYQYYHVNTYKMLIALVFCTLLLLALLVRLWRKNLQWYQSRHMLLFWLFLSLQFLGQMPGFLFNNTSGNYFFHEEIGLLLICILWGSFLLVSLRDQRAIETFLNFVGATVLATSFLAIMEFRFAVSQLAQSEAIIRPISSFGNANYFAAFLIMLLPLFFMRCWVACREKPKSYLQLIFNIAILCSGTLALLYSQSRAALPIYILAIIASVLFIVSTVFSRRQIMLGFIPLLLICSVSFLGLLNHGSEKKLFDRFDDLPTHLHSRLVPWNAAIAAVKERPVLGYGPGSSYELFFRHVAADSRLYWYQRSYKHVHNDLLQVLEEGGVVGLLCYLMFWGLLYFVAFRTMRNTSLPETQLWLVKGIVVGVASVHLYSFVSVAYRMASVKLTFVTLIGILLVIHIQNLRQPVLKRPQLFVYLSVFPIVLMSAWYALLPSFISYLQLSNALALPAKKQMSFLEDRKTQLPNIHSLYVLAGLQVSHKDSNGFFRTFQKMEAMIKNYRSAYHLEAVTYFNQGLYQKAKNAALRYQKSDRYHRGNVRLLMQLSLIMKNRELFLEQLNYNVRLVLLKHKELKLNQITFETTGQHSNCSVESSVVSLVLSESQIDRLITLVSRINSKLDGEKRRLLFRQLQNEFLIIPCMKTQRKLVARLVSDLLDV